MTRQRLQLASLLITLGASVHGSLPLYEEPLPFDFHAYAGFRQDQLRFGIREKREKDDLHHLHHHRNRDHRNSCQNGCHSDDHDSDHQRHRERGNEASIKWKSLNMAQVGAIMNYSTCNHYCFKLSADYGKIMSGHADIDTRFHFKTLAPPEPDPIPLTASRSKWNKNNFGYTVHRQLQDGNNEDREFFDVLVAPEDLAVSRSHKKHKRRRHHRHKRHYHHHEDPKDVQPPRYVHHVEVTKQRASASDGNVADLSGAIGWKVITDSRRSWISGLLGWSGSAQHLHLDQVVVDHDTHNVVGLGPLRSVSASYQTRWQGPWVGFDFVSLVDFGVTVFGGGEWHWASFESNGYWKYGDFFNATIRQRARAYGVKGTLGVDWDFCSCWTLGIIGDYQQWSTRKGSNNNSIRRKNLTNDDVAMILPVIEKSTLRRTRWISFSVSLQLAYRF